MHQPASPLLLLAALLATGCVTRGGDAEATRPEPDEPRAPAAQLAPEPAPAPGEGATTTATAAPAPVADGPLRPELQPPPGLAGAERLLPLEGEELDVARTPLEEIRATLPAPLEAAAAAADAGVDAEPPLQAQRLFGRAQQAILQNDHAEGVQILEAAARLAPGEPRILRELAGGWLRLGNRPRAVQHLREAVRRGGGDPDARLLLGQLLVDAGEPEAGLAELLAVHDAAGADRSQDPALAPLAAFHGGRTLAAMGRLAAALELFDRYRDAPRTGLRPSRAGSALLEADRGGVGQRVREGDLRLRLGQPEEAAADYAAAEQAIPPDEDDPGEPGAVRDPQLVARTVYTDLRLGRDSAARDRLVGFTARTGAAPAALALVAWAVESGLPGGALVEQLRSVDAVEGGADPAALALTLAVSLPREEAIALLRDRQAEAGFEPRVYDALLALLLAPVDGQPRPGGRVEAAELALQALRDHPERSHLAAVAWFRRVGDAAAAAAALDGVPTPPGGGGEDAALLTLRTVVERQLAGDPGVEDHEDTPDPTGAEEAPAEALEEAIDRLARALELQPDLLLARVERARLLGVAGRHDEALAELDRLPEEVEDPRVPRLRVGLLMASGRQDEAAEALGRLVRENPQDPALVLQQAQLLAAAGDAAGAERALLDALAANPRAEPVYAALLRLYDDETLGPSLPDYPQNYERLRRRIFQEIPESRVARLTAAAYLEASGDRDKARRVLEELLEGDPADREAQLLLLDVLRQQGDADAAGALIDSMLAADPTDPATLAAARDHFARSGDRPRLIEALKGLRDLQEPGPERAYATARIRLLEEDNPGAAEAALEAAAAGGPELSAAALDVLFAATRGMDAGEAEPLLLRAREVEPSLADEVAFSLALLYDAAGRGDEAEAVLVEALAASPDDPDLNNAVGYRWAYRGIRLDEAERLIGRAVAAETDNPAYLDSLGWVLYMQGRFGEALGWLEKSRERPGGQNPVILLHLGDTLHRLGRTAEAEPVWSEVVRNAAQLDPGLDPELVGIAERAQARLDAAEAGEPVPVSRTAAEPGEAGGDVPVAVEEKADPAGPPDEDAFPGEAGVVDIELDLLDLDPVGPPPPPPPPAPPREPAAEAPAERID